MPLILVTIHSILMSTYDNHVYKTLTELVGPLEGLFVNPTDVRRIVRVYVGIERIFFRPLYQFNIFYTMFGQTGRARYGAQRVRYLRTRYNYYF